MTHELKPTTAEERAEWKQLPFVALNSPYMRLIADVDRLEKWVCDLQQQLEAKQEPKGKTTGYFIMPNSKTIPIPSYLLEGPWPIRIGPPDMPDGCVGIQFFYSTAEVLKGKIYGWTPKEVT